MHHSDRYSPQVARTGGAFNLRLKRDIALVVSIKVLIVLSAALFVFGAGQRPHVNDMSVHGRMLDNSTLPAGSLPK